MKLDLRNLMNFGPHEHQQDRDDNHQRETNHSYSASLDPIDYPITQRTRHQLGYTHHDATNEKV